MGIRVVVLAAAYVAWIAATAVNGATIRNVILCIGDGMGPEHVHAGHCFVGSNLSFEAFSDQAALTTRSANAEVTDSAAAATAMATGRRVNNGVISVALPGDGAELQTLVEYFAGKGKRTGLVTTTYMTHATPAAFGAHETSRASESAIAVDYLTQTKPNVLFGGGAHGLTPAAAVAAGYTVVTNSEQLLGLDTESVTNVSGQFGVSVLPYEYTGLGDLPHLSDMTSVALATLDNGPHGFFLMVEGGLIDYASHANSITDCVYEVAQLDRSVQRVLEWAGTREDTLVIVTADHETGGLTVLQDNGAGNVPLASWTTTGHTSTKVNAYGWGCMADGVALMTDNTNVYTVARTPVLTPAVCTNITLPSYGTAASDWLVVSGDVYRAEHASNLAAPWSLLGVVTALAESVTVTDTNAVPAGPRFYRLRSLE
ncbi:MAG: alkaline phosphatase [Kiritimatiellae bacterium]|nr:alkaline phosphatase [Kiritimatiellia bacterium]